MYNDTLTRDPSELPLITAAQRANLTSSGANVQLAIFDTSGPRPLWYRSSLFQVLQMLLTPDDTRTGAGAVGLTTPHTQLVTTGANALTLANGADGQLKLITHKTDGGDGTLTPTTPSGFSTITFTAVGQSALLLFKTGVGWIIVAVRGATVA